MGLHMHLAQRGLCLCRPRGRVPRLVARSLGGALSDVTYCRAVHITHEFGVAPPLVRPCCRPRVPPVERLQNCLQVRQSSTLLTRYLHSSNQIEDSNQDVGSDSGVGSWLGRGFTSS